MEAGRLYPDGKGKRRQERQKLQSGQEGYLPRQSGGAERDVFQDIRTNAEASGQGLHCGHGLGIFLRQYGFPIPFMLGWGGSAC